MALSTPITAHDIPNARVDRSIQVDLTTSGLRIDYEVSLAELTLTQDLRSLVGRLPEGDRPSWFRRYGEVTGPLNAKGFLIRVDETVVPLEFVGFDLVVDEHPRFFFHFEAPLPSQGKLRIQDTNYVASEGTSRLAIRGGNGVQLRSDTLPDHVQAIPIRPVWQLSDEEERRTKEVEVDYRIEAKTAAQPTSIKPVTPTPSKPGNSFTRLLDHPAQGLMSWVFLGFLALTFGAVHSLQPGHGKTLAAAASVGTHHPWRAALILGISTTLTHLLSVVLIAFGLWYARGSRFESVHQPFLRAAGFGIAAIGCWRLGRQLRGVGTRSEENLSPSRSTLGLIGLGMAGGLVPCWEAIGLVVLSESVGRLSLGLFLLAGFSLGMGAVLVLVAGISSRMSVWLTRDGWRLARSLGLGSSMVLVALGVWLLAS